MKITCLSKATFITNFPQIHRTEMILEKYEQVTFLWNDNILHGCYLHILPKIFEDIKIISTQDLPTFKEIITIGSSFQEKIWQLLTNIPEGETKTYGQIAQAAGVLGGARAVGQAVGANPVGIYIPCHRVVAANGKLGGFAWGTEVKRRWLNAEDVKLFIL